MNLAKHTQPVLNLLRLVIWLLPLIILYILFYNQQKPSGYLEAIYNFQKNPLGLQEESPIISHLVPKSRLYPPKIENNYQYQEWHSDPIYLDLKMPRVFETIEIEITHRNKYNIPFSFAYQKLATTTLEWEWEDLPNANPVQSPTIVWQKSTFSTKLQNVNISNRKLRFRLSAPTLKNSHKTIDIKEIKVIFKDKYAK